MRIILSVLVGLLALFATPSLAQTATDSQRYLTLSDVEWRLTEGTNFQVTGVVVNTAPRPMRDVQLLITGFDDQGFPLTNSTYRLPYVQGDGTLPFTFDSGAANKVHRVDVQIVGGALDPP